MMRLLVLELCFIDDLFCLADLLLLNTSIFASSLSITIFTLQFLFWKAQLRLYEVIIGAVVFGIIFTYIYLGHWKYLRKVRDKRWD